MKKSIPIKGQLLIFLALLFWLPVAVNAQLTLPDIPSNSEFASRFELSTEMVFRVKKGETYMPNGALIAYINGEIRGAQTTSVIFPSTGIKVYKIMVFNDNASGDLIRFKFYNIVTEKIYDVEEVCEFVPNLVPDYANPIILNARNQVIVQTNPLGRSFSVDGVTYNSSQTFTWITGSSHMIGTSSPQGTGGTRYVWQNWNDGGAIGHTVTVPEGTTTYTADFLTQNLLTTSVSPSSYGSIAVNPTSPDGYYNSGTSAELRAVANSGYVFYSWQGDLAGMTNPQSIVMSAPRYVTAVFSEITEQSINLTEGWNIFSLNVTPENVSMMNILQPLISEGSLIKVQDETGAAIEPMPLDMGWINNIGNWSMTEGYKIRVNQTTNLAISGTTISEPVDIGLLTGWNIIGYPAPAPQNAMDVLDELIASGSLMKVQDETGAAIEPMPFELGWINNIGNFEPGEGYKVRVSSDDVLTITPSGTGGLKTTRPFSADPVHFKTTWEGNGYDHMNVYLTIADNEESSLQPGDEIAVYDGDHCVGAVKIGNQDVYSLFVTADDPTTDVKDGFTAGNSMTFRIWNESMSNEIPIGSIEYLNGYSGVFEPMGTTAAILDLGNTVPGAGITSLGDNYPNPFNLETTIPFTIGEKTKVDLSIYDVLGQRLATLVNSTREAGSYEITWDGSDNRQEKLKPGVYFCRMVAGNKALVKTIEVID
ncbi:MAG: T9SS type A sorting domain-containing protein [Bacteroidales bacterium]|nr:T9SS type A sorting domain-containing protein [Bacteroidales bacterium]